ncbi:microfibril-associated glycoprotein 4-like [Apostichopus japonicus]|uniref:microfibril-associated glycoprotein 4-like n=1 Tax=Stichopus japonicus TaxID=307972 RepID=UPI003AB721DD
MSSLKLALVVLCALSLPSGHRCVLGPEGENGPHEPRGPPGCYPPSVYNPVNTITVNACCNRTEEDDGIKQELDDIKDLLNTLISALENGDYCPGQLSYPKDCYEVQENGDTSSGVYTIQPDDADPFQVYCDMDTDGGGWTVFQRREDGSEDFFRSWNDYKDGFGSLEGEHWLGNEKLYSLTNQRRYGLRVDLGDFEDATRFAKYDSFVIADSIDKYRLQLGAYSGNAGDAMTICDNEQFSTRDMDNDIWVNSCALSYKGGWWYEKCHFANLNGAYLEGDHSSYADGVNWQQWRGYHYSLKFSEMKLRPI